MADKLVSPLTHFVPISTFLTMFVKSSLSYQQFLLMYLHVKCANAISDKYQRECLWVSACSFISRVSI